MIRVIMTKKVISFICLFILCVTSFSGCAPAEPLLPEETITQIKGRLGYALAPTWIPDGFEFESEIASPDSSVGIAGTTQAYLAYDNKDVVGEMDLLLMIYPAPASVDSSFMEQIGVIKPEDAVSEIKINGDTAYLTRGGWTDETLRRISRIELPINPEWDYAGGYSIRFTIEVPDNERVWVRLFTLRPTDRINEQDIVKIARSFVVIE
jgi:hypothetical protein